MNVKNVLVRVFVVGLLVTGAVATGIAIGFTKEANNNEGVSAVQCMSEANVGYVYSETRPEYLDVYAMAELEDMVYDMYLEECTEYCEHCDLYYYDDCMCNACATDCYECGEYDFDMFIEDNYDEIKVMAEELLNYMQEDYDDRNNIVNIVYEL